MLEHLDDAGIPGIPGIPSIPGIPTHQRLTLDMLDEYKKSKKHKKSHHGKKSKTYDREYVQLAFSYGVVCSRYDTLKRFVDVAIAAKRGHLNDQLLEKGLTALSLPEP